MQQITPQELYQRIRDLPPSVRGEAAGLALDVMARRGWISSVPPALSEFVESTTRHELDGWQHHLCGVLESLAETTGLSRVAPR
jgi:hypothetical protein